MENEEEIKSGRFFFVTLLQYSYHQYNLKMIESYFYLILMKKSFAVFNSKEL